MTEVLKQIDVLIVVGCLLQRLHLFFGLTGIDEQEEANAYL